jgi:hypothetical protein
VPANKRAIGRSGSANNLATINYVNGSAGSIGYQWFYLLSGETAGTKLIAGSQSTLVGTASNGPFSIMAPGDAVVINVDANSAGQLAYVTVIEVN